MYRRTWYDGGMSTVLRVLLLIVIPLATLLGWVLYATYYTAANPMWYMLGVSFVLTLGYVVWCQCRPTRSPSRSSSDETYTSLLQSQEKFVTLYQQSPIPYIVLDAKGTISMFNKAAVRIFATEKEHLWGASLDSFLCDEPQDNVAQLWRGIAEQTPLSDVEVQIKTAEGTTRWVLVSLSLSAYGAERLVTLVDITHQKEVEAVKSEFVALATHQLRTPIAAIRWNVELLWKKLDLSPDDGPGLYLTKIDRNVARMNALINDFLNVSKLEMGTFATDATPVELHEYFESVIEEFSKPITSKQITVQRSYEPAELTTCVDQRLLHIIVSNVLSNAVKYTNGDGEVRIGYACDGEQITITIADTGIGIPTAEHSKLFGKFYRASNALQQEAEGTGLGLYVVRQSVEQLGGTIDMQSAEGEGTTFTITIPHTPPE